jgi:hypothetical protein
MDATKIKMISLISYFKVTRATKDDNNIEQDNNGSLGHVIKLSSLNSNTAQTTLIIIAENMECLSSLLPWCFKEMHMAVINHPPTYNPTPQYFIVFRSILLGASLYFLEYKSTINFSPPNLRHSPKTISPTAVVPIHVNVSL